MSKIYLESVEKKSINYEKVHRISQNAIFVDIWYIKFIVFPYKDQSLSFIMLMFNIKYVTKSNLKKKYYAKTFS